MHALEDESWLDLMAKKTKANSWYFFYLLFQHQTGWSPERLSTYFTTFVRIVVERTELFQLSIPVLESNNVDAVVKFLLELVVLVRRIIYLSRRRLLRQVICTLGVKETLNGLTRRSVGIHDGTSCTDTKNH